MFNICPKCNKKLVGLSYDYGTEWLCSDCVEDKKDVLHCETGCIVVARYLDNGYDTDAEQAQKFLTKEQLYKIQNVKVGRCSSKVYLKEFSNECFNSVHFKRF